MKRRFVNEKDAFLQSADEHAQQVVRLLRQRRAEVGAEWGQLEAGWKANSERMATLKVRPRTHEENVVNLNVGGSYVNACWHLLGGKTEEFEDSTLGALLEGVWDKGVLPRDSDDRIVLDESPACIKNIIHAMLTGRASSAAMGLPKGSSRSALAFDEVPCLIYTAHVMGLPGTVPTHPKYVKMDGGSAILEPFEVAPFSAKVREWVVGSTEQMTLIYRATRDGFGHDAFTARCNGDSPRTVSLIRVSSGQEKNDDSIVGGCANRPWGDSGGYRNYIPRGTFMFMLKDGSATRKYAGMPIKWDASTHSAYESPPSDGPCFGAGALVTKVDKTSGRCTIQTKNEEHFQSTNSSPMFVALNGQRVVDIEVYRYSSPTEATTTAPSTAEPNGDVLTDAEANDIRMFGESIASSLMEERVVLDRAVEEMEAAGARVSAAVGALQTVYGPRVAAGEQDDVVELNVRGTRMTTLLSTLQACPRSALAAMFDAERWPTTDKDRDEHGRRLIDCSPTCFSKILDVLRMGKRASWSRGAAGEKQEEEHSGVSPGAVLIKEADMEAFGVAVNMYFPGCESFIMDVVQSA